MKTFAAAASMAALASAGQVMSMRDKRADFADAFISSFTGVTDSSTVDACFNQEGIVEQSLAAASLIKVNDYMRGYHRLYKIWNEAAQSQKACSNHRYFWTDSSSMGQWGSIAMQPTVAAETIVNNFADNKDAIVDAINRMETSLAADDFASAGADLADVVSLGLGDLTGAGARAEEMLVLEGISMPPEQYVTLFKSFMKQLIYVNRLDSLVDCLVDAKSLVGDIKKIWQLYQQGDEFAALTQITRLSIKARQLYKDQCSQGAPEDLEALLKWMELRLTSKEAMVEATSENALLHSQEIYLHVESLWGNLYGADGFKP